MKGLVILHCEGVGRLTLWRGWSSYIAEGVEALAAPGEVFCKCCVGPEGQGRQEGEQPTGRDRLRYAALQHRVINKRTFDAVQPLYVETWEENWL